MLNFQTRIRVDSDEEINYVDDVGVDKTSQWKDIPWNHFKSNKSRHMWMGVAWSKATKLQWSCLTIHEEFTWVS